MRPHTQTNVRRVPQMSTAKPHSGWPTPACAASPAEGPPLLFCDGFDSSPEDGFAHGLWQWQRNQCVIVSFLRLIFVRAIVKNALLLMPQLCAPSMGAGRSSPCRSRGTPHTSPSGPAAPYHAPLARTATADRSSTAPRSTETVRNCPFEPFLYQKR
jgi:hypothetical protein